MYYEMHYFIRAAEEGPERGPYTWYQLRMMLFEGSLRRRTRSRRRQPNMASATRARSEEDLPACR